MTGQPVGATFEDFTLGQRILHAGARTIGEGDASLHTALTGARGLLNSSDMGAALCGLTRRPMDCWLTFNLAFGLTVREISAGAIANLGYAEVIFASPLFAGDTIRCESEVIGLRPTSAGDRGIVYVRSVCRKADGALVLSWIRWVMLPRRTRGVLEMITTLPTLQSHINEAKLTSQCHVQPADVARICELSGSTYLWDDYQPGMEITHALRMTVTETEHMSATRLCQNLAQVHYASSSSEDKPLVYGGHVISLCQALAREGLENMLHHMAIHSGSHLRPVVAGSILSARTEVVSKSPLPERVDLGVLRLRLLGFACPADSTESELVLELDCSAVIPRKQTTA